MIQQSFLDVSQPLAATTGWRRPRSRLVARLNDHLAEAATQDGVLLLDVAHASTRDGIDAWFDIGRWLQGKMEIAPQAASRFAELLARVVDAHLGRSRKCLVLDLDNTLGALSAMSESLALCWARAVRKARRIWPSNASPCG